MSSGSAFAEVPIAAASALAGDCDAGFAVFLPGPQPDRPVLYREAGTELAKPDFERLGENGVRALYVRTQDLHQCECILEKKLATLLSTSELGPEEKVNLVFHVGTAVARDLSRAKDSRPDLTRAASIVDNVISCVLSDPLISVNMLRMAEHERTTAGHMMMVSALSVMLGVEVYGADHARLQKLGLAGMMHDIGKLAIRPEIINKPGALTRDELELIRQHPIESVRLLGDHPEATSEVRRIILQHHERVDGRGYPVGIGGDDLLVGSRILSIVDAFHAMIGRRPYRRPFTARQANRAMRAHAGRQFDRDLLSCWNDLFARCWLDKSPQVHCQEVSGTAGDEMSTRHEHHPKPPLRRFRPRSKRFQCNGFLTVACVYAGRLWRATEAPDEFVAPLHDISRGGVCIYSGYPMFRGEVVHVRLHHARHGFWVKGTVVWCKPHDAGAFRAGIRFEHRIPDSEAHKKVPVKPLAAFDHAARGVLPDSTTTEAPGARCEELLLHERKNAGNPLLSIG